MTMKGRQLCLSLIAFVFIFIIQCQGQPVMRKIFCFQCSNYKNGGLSDNCPMNASVNIPLTPRVDCVDKCFTRTDKDNSKLVVRGCTNEMQGLPTILPEDGCYTWRGATICLCSMIFCNFRPMKPSSGVSIDAHLESDKKTDPPSVSSGDITHSSSIRPTISPFDKHTTEIYTGPKIFCFDCKNYINGVYNELCPMNSTVNLARVKRQVCNGRCYTRTDKHDRKLVVRGCINGLPGLPETLPEDGCYDWNDVTICVCSDKYCNLVAIGLSSGKRLDGKVVEKNDKKDKEQDKKVELTCYDCLNYFDGRHYDNCPLNASVNLAKAGRSICDGKCYTRTDKNNKRLVVRGCTTTVGTLPDPLPKDGCYDWNGAGICVCSKTYCNFKPMKSSSGVAFDSHLTDLAGAGLPPTDPDAPLQCYQCSNYDLEGTYNALCPKASNVIHHRTYHDNCTGSCFTKSFKNNPKLVSRGCTTQQYGMPDPMAPNGCYKYRGEVFCVCDTSYCNGKPLGRSSGVRFTAHLASVAANYVEPDGIFRCYSCVAVDLQGNYWDQCPKHDAVSNAYLAPCNGSCITRSFHFNERQVGRGCSDTTPTLPDPLPPDGCYKYYLDTWCVCSNSRCNGRALGKPMDVELDAHLKGQGGSSLGVTINHVDVFIVIVTCLLALITTFPI